MLFITAWDLYYRKEKFKIERATYLNKCTMYTYYSYWICRHQPTLPCSKSSETNYWRTVVISAIYLFMACILKIHQLKMLSWHPKIKMLPLSSPSLPFPSSGLTAWCWLAPFGARSAGRLSRHGNGEKKYLFHMTGLHPASPPAAPREKQEVNQLWNRSLQEYFSPLKGSKTGSRRFNLCRCGCDKSTKGQWKWPDTCIGACCKQNASRLINTRPRAVEARAAITCLFCSSLQWG